MSEVRCGLATVYVVARVLCRPLPQVGLPLDTRRRLADGEFWLAPDGAVVCAESDHATEEAAQAAAAVRRRSGEDVRVLMLVG